MKAHGEQRQADWPAIRALALGAVLGFAGYIHGELGAAEAIAVGTAIAALVIALECRGNG